MPSSATAAIRTLSCLMLLALLAACERTPPPDPQKITATAPEEMPVATDTPPAPTQTAAPVLLPFSTDDSRVGTEVGVRSLGLGLATSGKAGWLMFGPYIPLPAGHYQLELKGSAHEGHSGVVHVDVAQSKGAVLIAVAEIDAPALQTPPSPDGIAVLPFTLTEASHDLEIRVRVTETSNLSISGFVIRSVP